MTEESTRHERELVAEEAEPKLKRPPLYQVVLLNDDYTPMEFVVDVLERIFGMDRTTATRVMLEVHTKGKGVCGVFTFRNRRDQGRAGDHICASTPASSVMHDGRNVKRFTASSRGPATLETEAGGTYEPPTQVAVPLFKLV